METEIGIDTPKEKVWEVLTDAPAYGYGATEYADPGIAYSRIEYRLIENKETIFTGAT